MNIEKEIEHEIGESINKSNYRDLYNALLKIVKKRTCDSTRIVNSKKLYYISAEFLTGKLLSNNLINLGIYDEVKSVLKNNGFEMSLLEEIDVEPSLGNGGLGRLAACFLDSIASLNISGDGIGLNYHCGLFKQKFDENKQKELPNYWLDNYDLMNETPVTFSVQYKDFKVESKMYDIDVVGYENNKKNKLHLFDLDTVNESIIETGIGFNKKNIVENLTLFLYPDDSTEEGKLLRIYQQYFMVSNAAQLIIHEQLELNNDLRKLNEYVVIQINDTHPSLIIPELIRLLIEKGLLFNEALEVVSKTVAYTNHTILAEALEKWPKASLLEVVPNIVPIIEKLDEIVKSKYTNKELHIIDENNLVHMARMDVHYCFSINGVASLHTKILKESVLRDFYDIYPNKFNNKTNGITFRRWLVHSNPGLVSLIDELGLSNFRNDSLELEKLINYVDDFDVLDKLKAIKKENKVNFAKYLKLKQDITINVDSIFDVQIKRIHEYKRQQMNVLYIIYKYLEIKKGNYPARPITFFFGGLAAPAYTVAKNIIHLILTLQECVSKDEVANKYIQIVMLENYNVTYAENIIPAADVSEQISLASKEASGTGNMKFMLNGAVTIGTLDGANVEIHDLVGEDNIYKFGKSSDYVINLYANKGYNSREFYNNSTLIRELVDYLVNDNLTKFGDYEVLSSLRNEILNKDWFMTLLDLEEYISVKDRLFANYENQIEFNKKCLVNIAKSGYFSSDRTIKDYNEDIWKIY